MCSTAVAQLFSGGVAELCRVLAREQEGREAVSYGTEHKNDNDDDPERDVAQEAKECTSALGKEGGIGGAREGHRSGRNGTEFIELHPFRMRRWIACLKAVEATSARARLPLPGARELWFVVSYRLTTTRPAFD